MSTKATTTSRGLGYQHRRIRKALLQPAVGTPCHLCGLMMLPGQALDLDHTPDRTGYRGMAHASCNRADGVRRGNRRRRQPGTSRRW